MKVFKTIKKSERAHAHFSTRLVPTRSTSIKMYRKTLLISLVIILLLSFLPVTVSAAYYNTIANLSATVTTAETVLNVRSGPGTGYSIVDTVDRGATVTVVGYSDSSNLTWYKISSPSGYVRSDYITANSFSITASVKTQDTNGVLIVRASPSVNAAEVKEGSRLPNGSSVTVTSFTGCTDNGGHLWYKISSPQTGYVRGDYLAPPITYTITKTAPKNGTFTVPTSATAGDIVSISSITANTNYTIGTVSVKRNDTGATVDENGTGNSRTFTMPASDVTVSVSFTPNSFKIIKTTPTNGSFTVPASAEHGSTVSISSITPNTNFSIEKVSVTRDDTGVAVNVSESGNSRTFIMPTSDVTVSVSFWGITSTVTFNKNGGSGGTDSVSVSLGSQMPTISTPSRSGYAFQGYNDSNGTQYYNANGMSAKNWDKTTNTTLNAQWTNTFTVTLDKNLGSGGTNSVTATYGSAMPTPIDLPTRYGFVFQGYFDSGGIRYYTDDGLSARNWDKTSPTTIYAKWANAYTITFSAHGTNGEVPLPIEKPHGVTITIPTTPIPKKLGYESISLDYWCTSDSQVYLPGSSYTKDASVTLYAHWPDEVIYYIITYDPNGGTEGPLPQQKPHGKAITLSDVIPVRENCRFLGWSRSSIASSATYLAGESYPAAENANVTLFAVWTYRCAYDDNGGSGGPGYQEKYHDIPLVVSGVKPIWLGYKFLGWAISKTASSPDYIAGENHYVENRPITLYAVWEAIEEDMVLSINKNGSIEKAQWNQITRAKKYILYKFDSLIDDPDFSRILQYEGSDRSFTISSSPHLRYYLQVFAYDSGDFEVARSNKVEVSSNLSPASIALSSTTGIPGETVTITCSVNANFSLGLNTGIYSGAFDITLDESLIEYVSSEIVGGTLDYLDTQKTINNIRVLFESKSDINSETIIFKLKFKISSKISGQTIPLKMTVFDDIFDSQSRPVPVEITSGKIVVVATQYIRGDVDGDGMATLLDALLILDYVSGKIPILTETQLLAADLDGDRMATLLDALRILDYISGIRIDL